MITEKEITKGQEIPEAYKKDLAILLDRANKLRAAYGKPLMITSGYREINHHINIYKEKAANRGMPFYMSQVPMKSKHLHCQALDFADANGELKAWINNNIKLLEEIGLWCEDFQYTKTWVHIQILPPASGNRFFKP